MYLLAQYTEMPSPHVEGWGSNPNAIYAKPVKVVEKHDAAAATRFVEEKVMTSCTTGMGGTVVNHCKRCVLTVVRFCIALSVIHCALHRTTALRCPVLHLAAVRKEESLLCSTFHSHRSGEYAFGEYFRV